MNILNELMKNRIHFTITTKSIDGVETGAEPSHFIATILVASGTYKQENCADMDAVQSWLENMAYDYGLVYPIGEEQ